MDTFILGFIFGVAVTLLISTVRAARERRNYIPPQATRKPMGSPDAHTPRDYPDQKP